MASKTLLTGLCLGLGLSAARAADWADCDAQPPELDGPFQHTFWSTVYKETQFFVQYPTAEIPQGKQGWPVVVFMHALNLGWEWYQSEIERWASHGILVVFPFIKSEFDDDTVSEEVEDTTGQWLQKGVAFVQAMVSGAFIPPPGLKGGVDLMSMAFAGHNMGAVSALRIGAIAPKGTVKLVVALHPFVCGLGPPPPPFTIRSGEITRANQNAGLLFFTAENDKAFGPFTAYREKKCFESAQGDAIFASFKASACDKYPDCSEFPKDGQYAKIDCKGKTHAFFGKPHFCPCSAPGVQGWVSPEEKWVTVALRAYLQGSRGCSDMLYGLGNRSLSSDPNVADRVVQRGGAAALVV